MLEPDDVHCILVLMLVTTWTEPYYRIALQRYHNCGHTALLATAHFHGSNQIHLLRMLKCFEAR